VIVCPASIEAATAKDESVGHVEWRVPAAVDNSGFQPTVTVIPALVPPVLLPIGNNSITYTAEDGNKNKARCSFTVTVRGMLRCPVEAKVHTLHIAPFSEGIHCRSAPVWHALSRDSTVLPATHAFIYAWNEPYLPLPSQPKLVLIY